MTATPPTEGLADFSVLLERVRQTFNFGLEKIQELKVQTYWEAGRLIHEHLAYHDDQPTYGKQLILNLAQGVGVGDELLYRILRFYQAFPISSSGRKLTWSHYRILSRLPDKQQRLEFEESAARENWTAEQLAEHLRSIGLVGSQAQPRPVELLEPIRGRPGIYRVVADGSGLAVDLGFTSYFALKPPNPTLNRPSASFPKENDLVRFSSFGCPDPVADAVPSDLYTYLAEVLRVIDGDTLWLKIWLNPPFWLREKVRLRGIDCPELATPEGRAAKQFVEKLLKQTVSITVTTTKPDKWDRYLSDLFLRQRDGRELFLNNLLLENGHARRYDKVRLSDWE